MTDFGRTLRKFVLDRKLIIGPVLNQQNVSKAATIHQTIDQSKYQRNGSIEKNETLITIAIV